MNTGTKKQSTDDITYEMFMDVVSSVHWSAGKYKSSFLKAAVIYEKLLSDTDMQCEIVELWNDLGRPETDYKFMNKLFTEE